MAQFPRYFNILGEPVLRWKVYASLGSVLMIVGGLIGAVYFIMLQNRRVLVPEFDTPVSELAPVAPEAVPVVLEPIPPSVNALQVNQLRSPLEQLLEQHLRATNLDGVNSYIAEGTFGGDAGDQILLIARAPNLYKYKTRYLVREAVVEFGYDGEASWLHQSRQKINREQAEFFTTMAIMESSLTHLAWSYRSSAAQEYGLGSVLELLPEVTWQGRTCAVVLSRGILPISMYHYIDTRTYREVHRHANLTNEKGVVFEVGLDFDPPDEGAPYGFPKGYKLFVAGELHDEVSYTEIRNNSAILSSLFDPPSNTSHSDLVTRP